MSRWKALDSGAWKSYLSSRYVEECVFFKGSVCPIVELVCRMIECVLFKGSACPIVELVGWSIVLNRLKLFVELVCVR